VLIILLFLAVFNAFRFIGLKTIFDRLRSSAGNYSVILLIMMLSYMIFLFISISFFDAHTLLKNRILSPLFPMVVLLICPFLQVLTRDRRVKIPVIILLSFILISSSAYAYRNWSRHFTSGNGYTSREWRLSETVERLEDFKDYQIYTNGLDVLRLYFPGHTGQIRALPSTVNANTKVENDKFHEYLAKMKASIDSGKGVLIYFDKIDWRNFYAKKEDLLALLKEHHFIWFEDGFAVRAGEK